MTATTTANALYLNADGTAELVVLDDTDCYVETVQADLSEADLDALYAGQTDYRVGAHKVAVGDGDTFYRLTAR